MHKMSILIRGFITLHVANASMGCLEPGQSQDEEFSSETDSASVYQSITIGPVSVIEATYGARCGVSRGNATWSVVNQCNGYTNCPYQIAVGTLGDPAHGCPKDFDVRWACGDQASLSQHVVEEANLQTVTLACGSNVPPAYGTINVLNATYGGNCSQPTGNVTWDVASLCSGYGSCRYDIRAAFLGDPAYGCAKEFYVKYTCSNNPTTIRQEFASKEADRKTVTLICPP